MIYRRNSELFAAAQQVLPGGVNSPVRAFNTVGGDSIFIREANGAHLADENNHKYTDYIASWSPLILGRTYPPVIEAIIGRAKKGASFGIPTEVEVRIVELAISMVPSVDKIRFVDSGTETCMNAIRLAHGYIGKEEIIKFAGCYHGHFNTLLIEASSGGATFGTPNSPGVIRGTAKDTPLANYNGLSSVKALFEANPQQITCVTTEPVAGNMGCVPPIEGFLEGLRQLCTGGGALLIFDEVMTGFHLAKGGTQEAFGIKADIVTFGEVAGGGLPVEAFAGSREMMSYLAPEGPVYQAGTLSDNPPTMSAGLAIFTALNEQPEVFGSLAKRTVYLHKGSHTMLEKSGIPCQVNNFGSMFTLLFTEELVTDFASSARSDTARSREYLHEMLREGAYLPPSAFESYFLNDIITYGDLDKAIKALGRITMEL